jgi:hypothetical protein
LALQGSLLGVSTCYHPTHIAIDDWFENAGSSFDLGEYKDHKEAHKNWETLTLFRFTGHFKHPQDGDTECSCCPEPERPTYSTKTRTPCLLSEILASIAEVEQLDGIPKDWQDFLSQLEYETDDEEDPGGVTENKEPLNAEAQVTDSRKATDLEVKGRRKELVDFIKELKKVTKSKLKDKDQKQAREREVDNNDAAEH